MKGLGLVPKQRGTRGKVQLLGISKRGDNYLRALLIHGARAALSNAKEPGPWLEQLKSRRLANVVVVAQAAKTARAGVDLFCLQFVTVWIRALA